MSEKPPISTLDYAPPTRRRRRKWPWIVSGISIGVLLGTASLLLTTFNQRTHYPWQRCSSNLRQLGLAMKMYANGNGGMFPPSWHEVAIELDDSRGYAFACPSAYPMIQTANGPTTRDVADAVADPAKRHNSYIYAAAGLNDNTVKQDEVLAFEWPADATDGSANVLLGDGRVERLDAMSDSSDRAKYWNLQDDYKNNVRPLILRP
ncbi:MAG: hypothetical protein QM754_10000 [Tepidisphaeraceae bacterium]